MVVVTGRHRLGGDEEKDSRGSDGFGFRVRFGFGWRGFEWSEWVKWSRVEWSRIVNSPRMTTARN